MFDESSRSDRILRLRDDEIEAFLAASLGAVIVAFSTNWSVSCRLLRPIVGKLAAEFAGQAVVVALDGDEAFRFRRTYGIEGIPQLLAFDKGRLMSRCKHGLDPWRVRKWAVEALRLPQETVDGAERAFLEAFGRAKAAHDEILAPAHRAVQPHLDAVGPRMDLFERQLAEERQAGRITDDEEMERRHAEFERVFGPFREEMDAFAVAEDTALRAYEDLMDEALDEYRAQRGATCATSGPGDEGFTHKCQPA